MKHLYIMRHGETLFNVQGRTQGWSDSPLTERGISDAKIAGKFMKNYCLENQLHFDHFYSSTSERACDTLELVFPGVAYRRLKGLKEVNFGQFEGQPQYLEVKESQGKATFFKQFGGDTFEEVAQRMRETMREMAVQTDTKNLFCVSHAGAIAILIWSFFGGKRPDGFPGVHNLDVAHFSYDENSGELGYQGVFRTLTNDYGFKPIGV